MNINYLVTDYGIEEIAYHKVNEVDEWSSVDIDIPDAKFLKSVDGNIFYQETPYLTFPYVKDTDGSEGAA